RSVLSCSAMRCSHSAGIGLPGQRSAAVSMPSVCVVSTSDQPCELRIFERSAPVSASAFSSASSESSARTATAALFPPELSALAVRGIIITTAHKTTANATQRRSIAPAYRGFAVAIKTVVGSGTYMRITGGAFRSRALVAPRGQETRPTSDRVREALFSMLASDGLFSAVGGPPPDAERELRILDLY